MWLLKKNVGVKVILIYDVIRNLTFLPQHDCQGAMVIRQPIHFSQSRLATLLYICLLSNYVKQTTPSVVFYVPHKFQLCRVCRWLKTSCIGANECDLGAKLCRWSYVGANLSRPHVFFLRVFGFDLGDNVNSWGRDWFHEKREMPLMQFGCRRRVCWYENKKKWMRVSSGFRPVARSLSHWHFSTAHLDTNKMHTSSL